MCSLVVLVSIQIGESSAAKAAESWPREFTKGGLVKGGLAVIKQ